jgi:hypothetical protein
MQDQEAGVTMKFQYQNVIPALFILVLSIPET